jgi:hypothetical protein
MANAAEVAPPFNPSDIITPDELAARLKVKPGWIYEQMRPARKNPLPVLKCGRFLRFSWAAVCNWLKGEFVVEGSRAKGKRR